MCENIYHGLTLFCNNNHKVVSMLNRNVWNDSKNKKQPKGNSIPCHQRSVVLKPNNNIFFNAFYTCAVIYDTTQL